MAHTISLQLETRSAKYSFYNTMCGQRYVTMVEFSKWMLKLVIENSCLFSRLFAALDLKIQKKRDMQIKNISFNQKLRHKIFKEQKKMLGQMFEII